MRRPFVLFLLLALLAGACTTATAPATSPPGGPTPTATLSAASPTATATASLQPTTSPSSPPTGSPTATPTASPTATATTSPTATPQIVGPTLAGQLQAVLRQQRNAYSIPGVTAAVLMPDGGLWTGAAGNARVSPRIAAKPTTPFVVGSITKTFVAALIMQLAEEGVLSLDDPLADWLPDYPASPAVTLRQLLAHTSGIFNYFEHKTYNKRVFGQPKHHWTPAEILADFWRAPYFAPGTGYHYSNTGFVLLGRVAEEATGNSLGEELRTRFFGPLRLQETYLQDDGPPPAGAAQGYLGANGAKLVSDGTNYRPTTSAATVAWAAGGIVACAADLARWADALYGGDLLEPASLAEMTDFAANPYSGSSYGLGTRTRFIGSHQVIGHTGSLRGYVAAMWHFPAEDITVVVLTNRGRIDPNPIADALAQIALAAAGYGP